MILQVVIAALFWGLIAPQGHRKSTMSEKKSARGRVTVEQAHCYLTFHPNWPLDFDLNTNHGSVSQNIPGVDGGVIFLHYGAESDIESYVARWIARYGSAAIIKQDKSFQSGPLVGRLVRIRFDELVTRRGSIPTEQGKTANPGPDITPARIMVCIGYTIKDLPVLVGYLLPRDVDKRIKKEAERIVKSLRPLSPI